MTDEAAFFWLAVFAVLASLGIASAFVRLLSQSDLAVDRAAARRAQILWRQMRPSASYAPATCYAGFQELPGAGDPALRELLAAGDYELLKEPPVTPTREGGFTCPTSDDCKGKN